MRVNEILSENKKQVNEALPLIAGLSIPAILAAISAVLAGWTIVEIVQFVGKYNDDPTGITDEQWDNLLFDILLIAVPGLAGKAIKKFIPNSVKRRMSQWLKGKVLKRYTDLNKAKADKARAAAGGATAAPADLRKIAARERLANIKARKKADSIVSALPDKVSSAFKVGIGLNIAHDYYTKISLLDEDWELYQKGDRTTKTFGNASEQEALQTYNTQKKKFLGEFMTTVGLAVGGLAAAKASSFVGQVLGNMAGGKLVGGVLQFPFAATAGLLRLASTAGFSWALFTQTKSGQTLLSHTLASAMQLIGGGTAYIIDLLNKAVAEIGEMLGVKVDTTPTLKQQPADELQSKLSNADYLASLRKHPLSIRKETDPTNPKIIYIGGVQFTDENGYQIASDAMVKDIRDTAAMFKVPDPTAGIQKKPG